LSKYTHKVPEYNLITNLAIPVFLFIVRVWPLWLSRSFSWVITALYYPFLVKRRHNYQENLKHILDRDLSRWFLFRTTFKMCVNYGYYLVDLFRFEVREKDIAKMKKVSQGQEHIEEAMKQGKGAILLTAHIGNWELGGLLASGLGYPLNMVYYPDNSEKLDRSRTFRRLAKGVKEIRLDPGKLSPLDMMRALGRNELVAMKGDRLFRDSGVKVPFFGAPARFPKGPVLLAMMTGAPIIPSFILLDKRSKYRVIAEAPIYAKRTGDRDKDLADNLLPVVAVFEKYIRENYEQWYCFSRFWDGP
jgi:lauroyl/myristoyl acyltransferase